MLHDADRSLCLQKGELENLESNIVQVYLRMYELTCQIRESVFGRELQMGAVDIYQIAQYYQVDIVKQKIKTYTSPFENELVGYIDGYNSDTDEFRSTIYVNNQIDELSRRYVIAHELAHHILSINQENKIEVRACTNTLFPSMIEETLCNKMASYLLMPLDIVFPMLDAFLARKREWGKEKDIFQADWLRELAFNLNLSDYHTILAYQDIRHLAGVLYERKFVGSSGSVIMKDWEKYKKYFR